MYIGKPVSSRMLSAVRRLCGQAGTGPTAVEAQSISRIRAPISPPPRSTLSRSSFMVISRFGKNACGNITECWIFCLFPDANDTGDALRGFERAGCPDAPAGVAPDGGRATRRLAAECARDHPHDADIAVRDVDGVGARPDLLLQRRLRAHDAGRQAPRRPRAPRGRSLGGDLVRHRAADRARPRHRRGDLGRGAAAVPRTQRLPGGDVPHVLLQSAAPGRRHDCRHVLRRHRGNQPRHRRAPAGAAARSRRQAGRDPDHRRRVERRRGIAGARGARLPFCRHLPLRP